MTDADLGATREILLANERFEVLEGGQGRFWARVDEGRWEPETFGFLARHCRAGTVLLDIGAWIGLMSLFAARRGARVVALEPDPVALRQLEANFARNALAVEAFPEALDLNERAVRLFNARHFGDSRSSLLPPAGGAPGDGIAAHAVTLETLEARLPQGARLVLKVDVEGHEYRLAEALAAFCHRHRAPILLSLHPGAIAAAEAGRGAFRARLSAIAQTRTLLRAFRGFRLSRVDGQPLSLRYLASRLLDRRGPRNFEIVAEPRR